jgi:hypothetical protein
MASSKGIKKQHEKHKKFVGGIFLFSIPEEKEW